MQATGIRRSARIASRTPSSYDVVNHQEQRQVLTLNDLPCEVIELIGQHLRDMPSDYRYEKQLCYHNRERTSVHDLGTTAGDSYSDPSWTFSCASKRYRTILFDRRLNRSAAIGYCVNCYDNASYIPEGIRANVSSLRLEIDNDLHVPPCDGCQCDSDSCCASYGAKEEHSDVAPNLSDVAAMFPNTSSLVIEHRSPSDCMISRLRPTKGSSDLQRLKTLHIYLSYAWEEGPCRFSDATSIIDIFHMPALEHIKIQIERIEKPKMLFRDIKGLARALCGIESSHLRRVTLQIESLNLWGPVGACLWTPVEVLIEAVLQQTTVESFDISIGYEMSEMEQYPHWLFIGGLEETRPLTRLTEMLVPNEHRLMQSVQVFKNAQQGRKGFSVTLDLSGRYGEAYERLLQWSCKPVGMPEDQDDAVQIRRDHDSTSTRLAGYDFNYESDNVGVAILQSSMMEELGVDRGMLGL